METDRKSGGWNFNFCCMRRARVSTASGREGVLSNVKEMKKWIQKGKKLHVNTRAMLQSTKGLRIDPWREQN